MRYVLQPSFFFSLKRHRKNVKYVPADSCSITFKVAENFPCKTTQNLLESSYICAGAPISRRITVPLTLSPKTLHYRVSRQVAGCTLRHTPDGLRFTETQDVRKT